MGFLSKFLLVAIAIFVIYRLLRNAMVGNRPRGQAREQERADRGAAQKPQVTDLVACPKCGAYHDPSRPHECSRA